MYRNKDSVQQGPEDQVYFYPTSGLGQGRGPKHCFPREKSQTNLYVLQWTEFAKKLSFTSPRPKHAFVKDNAMRPPTNSSREGASMQEPRPKHAFIGENATSQPLWRTGEESPIRWRMPKRKQARAGRTRMHSWVTCRGRISVSWKGDELRKWGHAPAKSRSMPCSTLQRPASTS